MGALDDLKKAQAAVLAESLPKLTDKSLPLDERWTIFVELSNAGVLPTETYGDGFLDDLQGTGGEMTMFDDFYVDRHETKSFVDMYDHIQESPSDFEGADVDGWREKVLASGYGAFVYDW